MIVDGGPRPSGASLYREHPCLVVEVLSPSARHADLREKLEHYRWIPTLDDIYAEVDVPRDPPRPHLRRLREPEAEYEATEGADVARVN